VVVVPAGRVPEVLEQCRDKGVRGVVLITAGFKEIDDPRGARSQEELARLAREAGICVLGPNTFGLVNRHLRLNLSFTPEFSRLKAGGISLVSQSGGIAHLLGFSALELGAGIGKIAGLGNRMSVDFPDMLRYLAEDPETGVTALYVEGVEEPRRLMRASREVCRKKPVVVYKTGRSEAGNRASLSHTGTMAGRQEIFEGACMQSGMYPVRSSEELLDLSRALTAAPPPRGGRIAVLSGQAGPGLAACDVLEGQGMRLARFSAGTRERVNELLPPLALRTNPVDMGPAWYSSSAVQAIVRAVLEDEGVDGLLLLMMYASANRAAVPELAPFFRQWRQSKPILTCFAAPCDVWRPVVSELEDEGVLVDLPTPERAARTMASMRGYARMMETLA
jgi:acyl-CoA synthetase (NDP forming)